MQGHNAKLKIVFISLTALVFSGCAKNASLTENNNIVPKQAIDIQNKKQINILFVGDMMFDRYIREAVKIYGKGDYNHALEPLKEKLSGYDLVVGNLEGPITDKESVSVGTAMDEKKNLVFTFEPATAAALVKNNVKLVDVGNNHILNQGEEGLAETKKYLARAGVGYFGDTGNGGREFIIRKIGSTKIGFVNFNYSAAGSFEKAVGDIENIRSKTDLVIVFPHWGTEYETGNPGQKIRAEAYRFIDAGADLIVGGHPHVIQMSEDYKGKKIYYSLGNFVFDQYFQKETTEGLGVGITVNPDLSMEYSELKFEMTKRGQTIFKAKP